MPKIAYLFGAGASAGEMDERGASMGILMVDIIRGILAKVNRGALKLPQNVANYLNENVNIEQLITLYEASGTTEHVEAARDLKSMFREELEERVSSSSADYKPALFAALLDMHSLQDLNEQLVLVMTTNPRRICRISRIAKCSLV